MKILFSLSLKDKWISFLSPCLHLPTFPKRFSLYNCRFLTSLTDPHQRFGKFSRAHDGYCSWSTKFQNLPRLQFTILMNAAYLFIWKKKILHQVLQSQGRILCPKRTMQVTCSIIEWFLLSTPQSWLLRELFFIFWSSGKSKWLHHHFLKQDKRIFKDKEFLHKWE